MTEEINLSEMPTEEILELMHEDLYDGILFVPEVLMAAKAMKAGMEVLYPNDVRHQL